MQSLTTSDLIGTGGVEVDVDADSDGFRSFVFRFRFPLNRMIFAFTIVMAGI